MRKYAKAYNRGDKLWWNVWHFCPVLWRHLKASVSLIFTGILFYQEFFGLSPVNICLFVLGYVWLEWNTIWWCWVLLYCWFVNIMFPFVLFSGVLYHSLESFWLPERGLKSKLTEYSLVWAKSQVGGCHYQLSCFITCNKCYSLTLCVSCCRHFSCVIINRINHRPCHYHGNYTAQTIPSVYS